MNFLDVFMLLEEDAESMATTFDVYQKGSETFVRFNNKEMTLREFAEKIANKNPEAVRILSALKAHPKFKKAGNLYTFLTKYLKDDDKKLDLVLKKSLTQYDNEEIARNSGDTVTKKPETSKYIPPRKFVYPKSAIYPKTTNLRLGS